MTKKRILVIGSSNTDMTVLVDALPKKGETVLGGSFLMGQGGKGANQAVAAKRLGGEVTFACKVGKDLFGDQSVEHYRKEGLDTRYVLRSDAASGIAMIPVSKDGENAIVVASGANGDFSVADVDRTIAAVGPFEILLLQLEIPVASVARAVELAGRMGAKVVLNPAPCCPLPDAVLRGVDLFIPNETELSNFTGLPVGNPEEAAKACKAMKAKGVKSLIVTMGSRGSMISDAQGEEIIPAHKVKAVDTTAAGDTFCGALCVGLSEGRTLRESVLFATAASALAVQKAGAQDSIPHRSDMETVPSAS